MTTIKQIAPTLGVKPESLQKRLKRTGQPYGLNDTLPDNLVDELIGGSPSTKPDEPIQPDRKPDKPKPDRQKAAPKPKAKAWQWEKVLAVLPLPMLGLAASYGVYYFAAFFTPTWVAIGEAAAFELTYIGLSASKGLNEKQQKRAGQVALGAVSVSVVYNSLAGAMHLSPDWFENLQPAYIWLLSVLHGFPLAVLAYQVALLLLHRKK
jgi:hypothetical protein